MLVFGYLFRPLSIQDFINTNFYQIGLLVSCTVLGTKISKVDSNKVVFSHKTSTISTKSQWIWEPKFSTFFLSQTVQHLWWLI